MCCNRRCAAPSPALGDPRVARRLTPCSSCQRLARWFQFSLRGIILQTALVAALAALLLVSEAVGNVWAMAAYYFAFSTLTGGIAGGFFRHQLGLAIGFFAALLEVPILMFLLPGVQ